MLLSFGSNLPGPSLHPYIPTLLHPASTAPCLLLAHDATRLPLPQLVFAGKSNGKDYALNLEFLHPLNAEASSWKVLQRSVQLVLAKEDADADFWVRLLKDKALEKTNVKIDWDK
jgi:hypothetical protein